MYKQLVRYLERPKAYTASDASIWTDEHIAKQMLSAHLDPEFEGATRSHAFVDRSVEWLNQIMPRGGKLLDVGCGPGLYAERLARRGFRVTGIDFSRNSIDYAINSAKENDLDIHYIQQDYLQMDRYEEFDGAIFIYCDYGALSTDDRAIILRNIYRSLKPGGRLILDVFSQVQYDEFQESKTWENNPKGGFWSNESYLELNASYRYDEHLTLRHTAIITEEEVRQFYLWDTYFTPETLVKEAEAAGFSLYRTFSDVAGNSYTADSPTLAVVLQKQKSA